MKRRLLAWSINAVLIAAAVITLWPLIWMFAASLMPVGEAMATPPRLVPSAPTLEHYRDLFSRLSIGRHLWQSLVIAAAITLTSVLFNAMAGYGFAKLRFAGRDRIFGAMLVLMVVPAQVAMLPLFLLLRSIGLINTTAGVVIPLMSGVFGIFLMRQFVRSVPDELLEAARIDGAGELRIFRSIVLPICRPVLVTLAIFTFTGAWNDFMWPLVVLTDDSKYTLPVAVAGLLGEHAKDTELMMASSVVVILPVLVLFLALQRHYIEGIMLGGVKE